jgi:hypothetical protein
MEMLIYQIQYWEWNEVPTGKIERVMEGSKLQLIATQSATYPMF